MTTNQPPEGYPASQPNAQYAQYGQYPPPPPYGQYGPSPYAQQPPPPPLPGSPKRWGPSSLGIDPVVAAGLAYLVNILSIVWLIAEKQNRYIRFHAAQALLIGISALVDVVVAGVIFVIGLALSASQSTATAGIVLIIAAAVLFYGMLLVLLVIHFWGMIAAFTGRATKFPIIGAIAERWAGGPVMPLF
jgi:uncharacterized membrane protein